MVKGVRKNGQRVGEGSLKSQGEGLNSHAHKNDLRKNEKGDVKKAGQKAGG